MSNLITANSCIINGIEFYVSQNNDPVGMSQRGLARLCGVHPKSIREWLIKNKLKNEDNFCLAVASNNASIIPLNICKKIVTYYTFNGKGTDLAYEFLDLPKVINKTTKNNRTENSVRNKLHDVLGGNKEVVTLAGNIDLLTSTEIIEVKNIKAWKNAIGQILVYSIYYPSHQKRIHLFGDCNKKYLDLIKQHCLSYQIKVTWEI